MAIYSGRIKSITATLSVALLLITLIRTTFFSETPSVLVVLRGYSSVDQTILSSSYDLDESFSSDAFSTPRESTATSTETGVNNELPTLEQPVYRKGPANSTKHRRRIFRPPHFEFDVNSTTAPNPAYAVSSLKPPFLTYNGSEPIYALMITGKDGLHCRLAQESIRSFLEQTYEPKVLHIVEDGDYSFAYLEKKYSNIKVIDARRKNRYKLGKLRNIALDSVPQGALWVQWDDDDYHHPQYIRLLYETMTIRSAHAVIIKQQVMYMFGEKLNWRSNDKVAFTQTGTVGTIMAREIGIRYPCDNEKGEDVVFWRAMRKEVDIVIWDNFECPEIYLRFIHGANTWSPAHFKENGRSIWRPTPYESQNYLHKILKRYSFVEKWHRYPLTFSCSGKELNL